MTSESGFDTAEETINRMRLRLADAMSDLRPVPTIDDLKERIVAVAAELHNIERELLLVIHLDQVEGAVFGGLKEIDRRLAEGWKPSGTPADAFVHGLRERMA